MTDSLGPTDASDDLSFPNWTNEPVAHALSVEHLQDVADSVEQVVLGQDGLQRDFERLAQAVAPLLSKQFEETQARVRILEKRILSRQERPTIVRLADLLTQSIRIESDHDARILMTEGLLEVMQQLGYQRFGKIGEPFDEQRFEAIEAEPCDDPIVTRVFAKGLESFGDILIRARVEVGPRPEIDIQQHEHGGTK